MIKACVIWLGMLAKMKDETDLRGKRLLSP
jgi:hypothetical protein